MKKFDLKQIRECAWELDREAQNMSETKHPSNKLLRQMESHASEIIFLCRANIKPRPAAGKRKGSKHV